MLDHSVHNGGGAVVKALRPSLSEAEPVGGAASAKGSITAAFLSLRSSEALSPPQIPPILCENSKAVVKKLQRYLQHKAGSLQLWLELTVPDSSHRRVRPHAHDHESGRRKSWPRQGCGRTHIPTMTGEDGLVMIGRWSGSKHGLYDAGREGRLERAFPEGDGASAGTKRDGRRW